VTGLFLSRPHRFFAAITLQVFPGSKKANGDHRLDDEGLRKPALVFHDCDWTTVAACRDESPEVDLFPL